MITLFKSHLYITIYAKIRFVIKYTNQERVEFQGLNNGFVSLFVVYHYMKVITSSTVAETNICVSFNDFEN